MNNRFQLYIDTGNAAFEDNPGDELARILEELARDLRENGLLEVENLRDVNGNTVGWAHQS